MQTTQGSLVIVDANTAQCKVYWNGTLVPCVGISVDNTTTGSRVVVKVTEEPLLAELQSAGIVIKRVLP